MNSILSRAGGIVHSIVDSIKTIGKYDTKDEDSIQVCVRIRPFLGNERDDSSAWNWKDKTISPRNTAQASYSFDHIFLPENSNSDIFESVVRNTVLKSMQGFHGTVFTYGQTNSGKTFTMNGTQYQPGIIPQSIHFCFDSIHEYFTDREFLIRVSYLEVYNEQIKDLLNTEPTQIKIQYDSKLGTVLSGVMEQVVLNAQQVIALLKAGDAHRHVGNTDMNEKSSRAHTLLKIIVESKKRCDSMDIPVQVSVLNLVDLAGSENAKMTNSTGDRAREAKCINQSLLTLSVIIQRLSNEKSGASFKQYLPYRDSKLTRLLQSSLSGKAQIAIICAISPTLKCVDESHNTLKFAARAKTIKTRAHINESLDDKTLLRAYKNEIYSLKARLAAVERNTVEQLLNRAIAPRELEIFKNEEIQSHSNTETHDLLIKCDETQDNDTNYDEDESAEILQMISEMERLILKADLTSINKKENSTLSEMPQKKSNTMLPLASKNDTKLRHSIPPRMSSIWSSSTPTLQDTSDQPSKIMDNNISAVVNVDPLSHSLQSSKSADSIEKAQPESRWKKDSVWRNIESPLVPFNLTDEEELSIGSAAYLTADSCFTDDSVEPLVKETSINSTCAQRKLSAAPSTRRFGFVPSMALSKSCSKIAKEDDGKNSITQNVEGHDVQNNLTPPNAVGVHKPSRKSDDQVQALFGVSEMLTILKDYVLKSSTTRRRSPQCPAIPHAIVDHTHGRKDGQPTDYCTRDDEYEILISELKKKDHLLLMLTEGLREVERNQTRWLADNDTLFQDLEEALLENQNLRERNCVIEEALQVRNLKDLSSITIIEH